MSFSCLVSCYYKDSPVLLDEAFSSIYKQTLKPDEIIFVEDGKLTEELYDVISKYQKKLPIMKVPLEENRGLGNALHEGLLRCNFDIVFRMDTDDICHPERFEKQFAFMRENPGIDVVGSWARDIDITGKVIGERTCPVSHGELYKIMWTCPIIHPTVAFRKASIMHVGSYRTDIKRRQDYELWMRAAAQGLKFANIPEYLLYYRFTESYYKKNNFKVALEQARMGVDGLNKMKGPTYAYLLVYAPVIRSLFPSFMIKYIHKSFNFFDPRKRKG